MLGGARFTRHGVGGLVEVARAHFKLERCSAQVAQYVLDRMLELRDGERNRVTAHFLRTAGFGLRLRQLFAFDHAIAENDYTARHLADFVTRVRRWDARVGVAGGRAL